MYVQRLKKMKKKNENIKRHKTWRTGDGKGRCHTYTSYATSLLYLYFVNLPAILYCSRNQISSIYVEKYDDCVVLVDDGDKKRFFFIFVGKCEKKNWSALSV